MDGNSEPYFRRYRYDFPQDTQLFSRRLSHHHWHIGHYRVHQQVKTTLVVFKSEVYQRGHPLNTQ
jgi:hypothetical protein